MLKKYDFFCKDTPWSEKWANSTGKGIVHQYELNEDGLIIFDKSTDLFWQQSGSGELQEEGVLSYISELNEQRFGGCSNWRVPTLEEAMSLMEPRQANKVYISPVFDSRQHWIWTSDLLEENKRGYSDAIWDVSYGQGRCTLNPFDFANSNYVRAVYSASDQN